MVKIRLRRVGSKKQTSFRVVVADSRSPRDGRFIEEIGFYNPRTEPETLRIDEEKALHWLSVGAQPTDSVTRLLKTLGTWDRFQRLKQGEPLEDLLAEAEGLEEEEAEEEVTEEALEVEEAPAAEEAPEAEVEEEAEVIPVDEGATAEQETEEPEMQVEESESEAETEVPEEDESEN